MKYIDTIKEQRKRRRSQVGTRVEDKVEEEESKATWDTKWPIIQEVSTKTKTTSTKSLVYLTPTYLGQYHTQVSITKEPKPCLQITLWH